MTRPDDVPVLVWSKAMVAVSELSLVADIDHMDHLILVESRARAIMATLTDAADLAQRMGAGRKSQSEQAKAAKKPGVARDFESMAMSAFDVSAAIRTRFAP